MPRTTIGDRPMTDAERQARHRANRAAAKPIVGTRHPGRRSKAHRWSDAIDTLLDILDGYAAWRDNLPPALAESATAERLDAVLDLRDLVEQLQAADLPRGFGRD
jgi:hypothetical protein